MYHLSLYRLLMLLLLALAGSADAEQKQTLGNWDVHYIAFPSTMLTPEIATQYKLQRSKYNSIVNISVLDSTSQQAQKVALTGQAKDLMGRQRVLEFSEVSEGDAVYYLAQFPFSHEQRYWFTITVRRGNEQQQLKFDQVFYAD